MKKMNSIKIYMYMYMYMFMCLIDVSDILCE